MSWSRRSAAAVAEPGVAARPGLGGQLAGPSTSTTGSSSTSSTSRSAAPDRPAAAVSSSTGGSGIRGRAGRVWAKVSRRRPAGGGPEQLQHTWTHGASLLARAVVPMLVVAMLAGPVALLVTLTRGSATPVAAASAGPSADSVARQGAAQEVAGAAVRAWLTATQDHHEAAARYWPQQQFPKLASTVGSLQVLSATATAPGVWSVQLAADVTAPSAGVVRRFYALPVGVAGGAGNANAQPLALPAQVAGPNTAGVTVSTAYSVTVPTDAPVGDTVRGLLVAMLTGSNSDLTPWLSPGASVRAPAPAAFTAVRVSAITADAAPAGLVSGVPPEGATARLEVTVTGQSGAAGAAAPPPPGATTGPGVGASDPGAGTGIPLQYLLTARARAGRWEVASVDPSPALSTSK